VRGTIRILAIAALALGAVGLASEPPAPRSRLYVRTEPPGARVILDGKEVGRADGLYAGLFVVTPGRHLVEVQLDGYTRAESLVVVPSERIERLVLTLTKRPDPPRPTAKDEPGEMAVKATPPEPAAAPAQGPYREERRTDMPVMRNFCCSEVINGRIYVFGGDLGPNGLTDSILVYDTEADSWRVAAGRMPYKHSCGGHATATCGGKVYISPGLGPTYDRGWGQRERVIEFDPVTETARERASFGAVVWGVSPVTVGNLIYWLGANGLGQEDKIWRHDPERDTIRLVSTLAGGGRATAAALGKDGRIYAFGGWASHRGFRVIDVYDPASNICATAAATLPVPGIFQVWPGPQGIIYLAQVREGRSLLAFDTASGKLTDTLATHSFTDKWVWPAAAHDPATGRVYLLGGDIPGAGNKPQKGTCVLIPTKWPPRAQ